MMTDFARCEITYGDYVAHRDNILDACEDAYFEARKHPEEMVLIVTRNDLGQEAWRRYISVDAEAAESIIRSHYRCPNVDTESNNFTCYTHSTTVEWIG